MYPKQIEDATKKRTKRPPVYLLFLILKMSLHCPMLRLALFLYKRKLTMYNLTAITSEKQGYCIYGLTQCRKRHRKRAGNDIASAFICILNKIASDEPHINNTVCWFESCVPQKWNSHISQAILEFLSRQDKYSLAGHSCVQEVDNMHKQIVDAMQASESYLSIPFLRMLLKVNRKKSYRVIQMNKNDFKHFHSSSKILQLCYITQN